VTTLKLDAKPATAAADALLPWAQELYKKPGMRIVGVVELAHVERTQPAPDEDKEASVKLRITHLELADGGQQENNIREAMKALYLHRNAQGTLTEEMDVELSKQTLKLLGDNLDATEAAKRAIAIEHWAGYARRALHTKDITHAELLHELKAIADGLYGALHRDTIGGDAESDA
jgi:hypothetical protein